MTTNGKPADQTALDEREIENPKLRRELEDALENREKAKAAKGEAAKVFKTKDSVVKDKLEELDLGDEDVVRIGRFRVTKAPVAAREVAFTTDPTSRLTIKVAPTEE